MGTIDGYNVTKGSVVMARRGDVLSYHEMCQREGGTLQRGMNFRFSTTHSVILMSVQRGAPYDDQILDGGNVLIYEGHDQPRAAHSPTPKALDQPMFNPRGSLSQNGLFYEAAKRYKLGGESPEAVRVYEKIRSGIWVYNGLFDLIDAWREPSGARSVFKFKLQCREEVEQGAVARNLDIEPSRLIPTEVKVQVWARDRGRCVICGSQDNLHFDHIIPYSLGGSSLVADNIQLLCARHNLAKHNRIE